MGKEEKENFISKQAEFFVEHFTKIREKILEEIRNDTDLVKEKLIKIQAKLETIGKTLDEIKDIVKEIKNDTNTIKSTVEDTNGGDLIQKIITIITALISLIMSSIALYKSLH